MIVALVAASKRFLCVSLGRPYGRIGASERLWASITSPAMLGRPSSATSEAQVRTAHEAAMRT